MRLIWWNGLLAEASKPLSFSFTNWFIFPLVRNFYLSCSLDVFYNLWGPINFPFCMVMVIACVIHTAVNAPSQQKRNKEILRSHGWNICPWKLKEKQWWMDHQMKMPYVCLLWFLSFPPSYFPPFVFLFLSFLGSIYKGVLKGAHMNQDNKPLESVKCIVKECIFVFNVGSRIDGSCELPFFMLHIRKSLIRNRKLPKFLKIAVG